MEQNNKTILGIFKSIDFIWMNKTEWILGFIVIILTGIVSTCYSYADNKSEPIATVVVDAGHGGYDPGKIGINDALEKDINLLIAKYLQEYLIEENIEVVMTRTDDSDFRTNSDKYRKTADLKARCEIMKKTDADYAISIHQNSFTDSNVKGAQVFYYSGSKEGEQMARSIQDSIKSSADKENTRASKANDDYYMLVNSPCPAVIVECGFLSNRTEAEKLCSSDYQKKLAKAICEGFIDYFEKVSDE